MKIGLISDTHDNIQNIQNAIISFNDKHVRVVIHAGNMVSPERVKVFDGMKVLGNNDLEARELTSAFDKIGGELRGEFCEIEQDKLVLQYIIELTQEERNRSYNAAKTMWSFVVIHTELKIKKLEKLLLILGLQRVGFSDMVQLQRLKTELIH